MSKEQLEDVETIRTCIDGGHSDSRCESFRCRWEMIGIVVVIEFINPKREKQTIKICGNVDCIESKKYHDLLINNNVADNQKLIIKTYKNDSGEKREIVQVRNNL